MTSYSNISGVSRISSPSNIMRQSEILTLHRAQFYSDRPASVRGHDTKIFFLALISLILLILIEPIFGIVFIGRNNGSKNAREPLLEKGIFKTKFVELQI